MARAGGGKSARLRHGHVTRQDRTTDVRPEDAVSRSRLALMHATAWISLLAACGGDDDVAGSEADAGGGPADAAPADASSPDAAVCTMTMCGDECVDTATSSAHCGGCDMACESPGQICSGALPCTCPPAWIPAELAQPVGSEIDTKLFPGLLVGIAPLFEEDLINAVLVGYVEETPVGTDIDLSEIQAPAPPLVAAAHDVDAETSAVHTPYLATSGTVNFTELCAQGVRGTLTDAVFVEVGGVTDPTPVEGGCQLEVPSLTFDLGEACDGSGADAGLASLLR